MNYAAFKKNRKGTRRKTEMKEEEEERQFTDSKAETKHFIWEIRKTARGRTRDGGQVSETVFGECSPRLGYSFVYSSGPRSSPSLWVLAGDYILGSGQRDGGGGPLESQTSPPVGPQHRHYPTPTRLKRETVQTLKRRRVQRVFHRFRRRRSTPLCFRN